MGRAVHVLTRTNHGSRGESGVKLVFFGSSRARLPRRVTGFRAGRGVCLHITKINRLRPPAPAARRNRAAATASKFYRTSHGA